MFTLKTPDAEAPLADFFIAACPITWNSLLADEVRLELQKGALFDEAEVFPYDSTIELWDRPQSAAPFAGGTRLFRGTVAQTPRALAVDKDFQGYILKNFWYQLEQLTFRQVWRGHGVDGLPTTWLFLNAGNPRKDTQGKQIREVLEWAQTCLGAGVFQIGDLSALNLPMPTQEEKRPRFCSEIIREQLKMSPDVQSEVDYSADPPILHFRRRKSWGLNPQFGMPEVTATVPGPSDLDITERKELLTPGVLLYFNSTGVVDGVAQNVLTFQKYPAGPEFIGTEPGSLTNTYDLAGANKTTVRQAIQRRAMPNLNDTVQMTGWWKTYAPWLADAATIADLQLSNFKCVSVEGTGDIDLADYPYELLPGSTITPWMETLFGIRSVRVKLTCLASYVMLDPAAPNMSKILAEIPAQILATSDIVLTNATRDDYRTVQSSSPSEAPPDGLAQYLYETHAELRHSGSLRLTAAEAPQNFRPGRLLNIESASGRYRQMREMIQSATAELVMGELTLNFGPPAQLGPDDILQWLRSLSFLPVYNNPGLQQNPQLASENVALGGKSPSPNATSSAPLFTKLDLTDQGQIKLGDQTFLQAGQLQMVGINLQTQPDGAAHPMAIYEMPICIVGQDGSWFIRIFASAPYQKA